MSTDPRPPFHCVRVNDGPGPFWGEKGLRPPSQILALRVYNMPTVSTISGRWLLVVQSVYRPQTALPLCAGKRWSRTVFGGRRPSAALPKYWHFGSATCRRCLQIAGRVYLWCTLYTNTRPPFPCVRVNDGSAPFWGDEGLRPRSQMLALRFYNMPTVSTISNRVYLWCTVSTDPRPPSPCVRVNDGSGPFRGEAGLRSPSQILALCV